MSYQSKDLSVLAYANGFIFWHYVTEVDTGVTVIGDGYFNNAQDMLRVGDIIVVNTTIDQSATMLLVTQSVNGLVVVKGM